MVLVRRPMTSERDTDGEAYSTLCACASNRWKSEDTWHSGRMDDIGATVAALNSAMPVGNPVALAGFSQGAIVAANYTVSTGAKAGVCCTVALSGSLDLRCV